MSDAGKEPYEISAQKDRDAAAAGAVKRSEAEAEQLMSRVDAMGKGVKIGLDWGVSFARAGGLRLWALPHEKGEPPFDLPIRPVRATISIWRAWWRERRG